MSTLSAVLLHLKWNRVSCFGEIVLSGALKIWHLFSNTNCTQNLKFQSKSTHTPLVVRTWMKFRSLWRAKLYWRWNGHKDTQYLAGSLAWSEFIRQHNYTTKGVRVGLRVGVGTSTYSSQTDRRSWVAAAASNTNERRPRQYNLISYLKVSYSRLNGVQALEVCVWLSNVRY